MNSHILTGLSIFVSLCLAWPGGASAQHELKDTLGCSQCSPPSAQQEAEALFLQARNLLEQGNYTDAADLYERALVHWDNPVIRYGLVRALYLQERLPEAYLHVVEVLRYSAGCFDPRMWGHVQKLASFLKASLSDRGEIVIICREPGARIELDEAPAFTCQESAAPVSPDGQQSSTCDEPVAGVEIREGWTFTRQGEARRFVSSRTHRISASKHLHQSLAKSIMVMPGKTFHIDVDLAVVEESVTVRRRMSVWPPWLFVGAGVTALAAGGLIHGLSDNPRIAPKTYYTAGAVTATIGVLMVVLNRPRPVRGERQSLGHISVRPLVADQSRGVLLDLEF
jgi:hypothetical protein